MFPVTKDGEGEQEVEVEEDDEEPSTETVKFVKCTIHPFDNTVMATAFGLDLDAEYGPFGITYKEAILLLLVRYPELMWLPVAGTIKIVIMALPLLPLGVLAVMSIDGDSLFQCLCHVLAFAGNPISKINMANFLAPRGIDADVHLPKKSAIRHKYLIAD